MLRQAVQNGYEEGYRAGQADREDGWEYSYNGSFGYEDASYGYDGYYVSLDEYRYYFREGFERGYEDGYYSRYEYGNYNNGRYSILGSILGTILDVVID
jgi:flagellar biosynthesis/type III secretory pathway protein FliH